jgi:drug/metabolite transporter (DMT)-like permease
MKATTKAHGAVLAANLFFGINFSVMKSITPGLMPPLALNLARVGGAALMFWLLWFWRPGGNHIDKKHRGRLLLCTITGVVVNQVLFTKGVSLTTPIHGSLLMMCCPIAVFFIAAWLHRELPGWRKIAGLTLGICGALLLISMREKGAPGENIILGDVLILINAVSYAFYLVLVRPLMQRYNAVVLNRWLFTVGLLMLLPIGWRDFEAVDWAGFGWRGYMALAFIVVAVTFLAYLFTAYGVGVLGSSVTGAYIYSQPVFAAMIAIAFAGDTARLPLKLLAAILIFTGVFMVSKKNDGPVPAKGTAAS